MRSPAVRIGQKGGYIMALNIWNWWRSTCSPIVPIQKGVYMEKFDISKSYEDYTNVKSLTVVSPTMTARSLHESMRLGQKLAQDHDKYYDSVEMNSDPKDFPIRPQRISKVDLESSINRLKSKIKFMEDSYAQYKDSFEKFEKDIENRISEAQNKPHNSNIDPV